MKITHNVIRTEDHSPLSELKVSIRPSELPQQSSDVFDNRSVEYSVGLPEYENELKALVLHSVRKALE